MVKVQRIREQRGWESRGGAQGTDLGLKIRSHWQSFKRAS